MLLKLVHFWIFVLSVYKNGVFCDHGVVQQPHVETPLGVVLGHFKKSHGSNTFKAFEGIPYAKPPVGPKRFEEPEPAEPWMGVFNATMLTECAHYRYDTAQSIGDEDCLHINIYVPVHIPREKKLDVIVHIHGGDFMYLSGHNYSHPTFLMDEEVVFVTFNYRLGVLGFLSTEDAVAPGNNGLKDQVLALKWIQDNIESFGGNPKSVTLTGYNSGGSSVHLHYFSNRSKDLFHRGFSQNGVALNPFALQENALMKTKKVANAVGCSTDNTTEIVACLKERSVRQILDQVPGLFSYRFLPFVTFGPVVEKAGKNPFLAAHPYVMLMEKKVHDIPWIASVSAQAGFFPVEDFENDLENINTNWESLAPVLLDFSNTARAQVWKNISRDIRNIYMAENPIDEKHLTTFVQIFTDRYYLADTGTALKMQSQATKSPVYFLLFDYLGNNETRVKHGADAKYFYATTSESTSMVEEDRKMKDLLMSMLIEYAKNGKPTFDAVVWDPVKDEKITYLHVTGVDSSKTKVVSELGRKNVWKSLAIYENEKLYKTREEWRHILC